MARFSVAAAALVCALTLLIPARARAVQPVVTSAPAVTGEARVGVKLTAAATWTGTPSPSVSWTWLRCAGPTCMLIGGATAATYVPVAADIGKTLAARLRLSNKDGTVESTSAATAVVLSATAPVPTPSPTPTPTASPTPTPTPSPSPTPEATPTPTPVAIPFDVPAAAPTAPLVSAVPVTPAARIRAISPFPLIRIKGNLLRAGARILLLRVSGPRGAKVRVDCSGSGCPRKTVTAALPVAHLKVFERRLPAGTTLRFSVTAPGRIGKWTEFVIRRNRPPLRRDRCLQPGSTTPSACPA